MSAGCSVLVHAAETSTAAARGSVVVTTIPTEVTTSKTGAVYHHVERGSTRNTNIYFIAEYRCADGNILEVSKVRGFNANRIKGLSKRRISKRAWIKAFKARVV